MLRVNQELLFSFFVYIYLDPTKPGDFTYGNFSFQYEPLYVGKGRDRRHLCRKNEALRGLGGALGRRLRAVSPVIIKHKEFLLEQEAFDLETTLIRLIGRRSLGTGPLFNILDGGDGWSLSEEVKRKISEKAKISQRIRYSKTEEREKMRLAGKQYFRSPGAKERLRETMRAAWTPAMKKALSEKVRIRCSDPNYLALISSRLRGRKFSAEARKNISLGHLGLKRKKKELSNV